MTGASQATGLGSAKAPEPSGLGPTGAIPSAAWLPMKIAPRDGTPIFGRTFDGCTLVAHYEQGGFMDEDEQEVGSWVAEYEGEHPDDWTDGACWSSNENDDPSDPLVGFIGIAGIASSVAEQCKYRRGTDNYVRIYHGALLGAKQALRAIASVGRNAERQDHEDGLGPKDEHAVGSVADETPNV